MRLPVCQTATVPGAVSQRACAFYGARWFLAPLRRAVHLAHSPVGCAFYGRTVRRKDRVLVTTALGEKDIVFGGEAKLRRALAETGQLFPEALAVLVYAACAPGLTGDDIAGACRDAAREQGRPVVPVLCPGFQGCSQASGHDIAARALLEHLVGREDGPPLGPKTVNILGEFDVQGDLEEIKILLRSMGVDVHCALTGDASVASVARAHRAALNLVHCRRTGGGLAEAMHEKFGQPYLKVSFFGLAETTEALLMIGEALDCRRAAEEAAAAGRAAVEQEVAGLRRALAGKRVGLFFGGSRIGSMLRAYRELGLEVIIAGAQFSGRDDYREAWQKAATGSLLIDDANEEEVVAFVREVRPDLLVGGTREKFIAHKLGLPFSVFPQESGPYAGYRGFLNFAMDIYKTLHGPVWRLNRGRWPCA